MKHDLFISHASEDKDAFVRPLANLLGQYGVNVWCDEFELRIGASISRSIDRGIQGSNYGAFVLSESFFAKNWTEYELRSFNSYEIDKGDIILPIWKGVNHAQVREFSPYLSDKFALDFSKYSIDDIALKLIDVVRPDLATNIHQRIALEFALKTAKTEIINDFSKFKPGPIRHPKLNENLISRIRLIRSSLWLGYPHSMVFWMDGFMRDINIESQIRFWERVGTCFLEIATQQEPQKCYLGPDDSTLYDSLFALIYASCEGHKGEIVEQKFNDEFIKKAREICAHNLPVYDIDEESPFLGEEIN